MKKIITSITAILLVGTSVINPGTTAINCTKKSYMNKVYAEEFNDKFSTSDAVKCGDSAYYTVTDDGTMTITGTGDVYNVPSADKNIKKLIVENGITHIGSNTFSYYENLESISLPDSLSGIGFSAFENTLWYNNQPDGLVYAGKVAYAYKGKMKDNTELTFKEDTTGIAEKAFSECTEITSVVFPDGITTIPYMSFINCSNLISVTIPDSITQIVGYAFFGCSSLEKITIPDTVTEIGSSAFDNCYMLNDIYFSDNLTRIGQHAFDNTSWYYSQPVGVVYAGKTVYTYNGSDPDDADLVIKDGTKIIADDAFRDCNFIKTIVIPDSVIYIGYSAFYGCSGLQSIAIPHNTEAIKSMAFSNCSSLKSVTIPAKVSDIGDSAFFNNNLESVTFLSDKLNLQYGAFCCNPHLKDVFYVGSEEDWAKNVTIGMDNNQIENAQFHFNYVPFSKNKNTILYQNINYDNDVLMYGDTTGDNKVDISDLIKLSMFMLGDTVLYGNRLNAADVSYNGTIDIADIATLKQYVCHDNIKLGPAL